MGERCVGERVKSLAYFYYYGWGGSLLNAIVGKHFEKRQFYIFCVFKNTVMRNLVLRYPWIPETFGNTKKLAFLPSSSFFRLISNYLLSLPFWGFY